MARTGARKEAASQSAPKWCDFAIAIADLNRRPNMAAISGARFKKEMLQSQGANFHPKRWRLYSASLEPKSRSFCGMSFDVTLAIRKIGRLQSTILVHSVFSFICLSEPLLTSSLAYFHWPTASLTANAMPLGRLAAPPAIIEARRHACMMLSWSVVPPISCQVLQVLCFKLQELSASFLTI